MHRRTGKILSVCTCAMLFCLIALLVAPSAAAANPKTPPPTVSPTTGKIDVYFFVDVVDSWVPTSNMVCQVDLSVSGEDTTFTEEGVLQSVYPNNPTCTVSISYSWLLQHQSSDTINLTYHVDAPLEGTANPTVPFRQSVQSGSMAVPASGTATHIYIDFTL